MAEIKKAKLEDFDRVYPLLTQITDDFSKNEWKCLFENNWKSENDYFGYILVDGDKIGGYFGCVFSDRVINGKTFKFCDTGNWIVLKEYRKHSVRLIIPFLKLKGVTVTNATASPHVYNILKKFGFQDHHTHFRVIPMNWIAHAFNKEYSVSFNRTEIKKSLNPTDLKIFEDHSRFHCLYFLIKSKDKYCFGIATKTVKKNIEFALVHYVSHPDVFKKSANKVGASICKYFKVKGLLISEQDPQYASIKFSFRVKMPQANVFKSSDLGIEDINFLYSELILLSK